MSIMYLKYPIKSCQRPANLKDANNSAKTSVNQIFCRSEPSLIRICGVRTCIYLIIKEKYFYVDLHCTGTPVSKIMLPLYSNQDLSNKITFMPF